MRSLNSYIILAAILNYVVDGYAHYSASALGGVVFVRNIVRRPPSNALFARQVFYNLLPLFQIGAVFPLCEHPFLTPNTLQVRTQFLTIFLQSHHKCSKAWETNGLYFSCQWSPF